MSPETETHLICIAESIEQQCRSLKAAVLAGRKARLAATERPRATTADGGEAETDTDHYLTQKEEEMVARAMGFAMDEPKDILRPGAPLPDGEG